MTNYYTGIGSRSSPPLICVLMTKIASTLASQGMILRSGHADRADLAFEKGCNSKSEIYLPWPSFNNKHFILGKPYDSPLEEAFDIASQIHPNWNSLNKGGKACMARNCHQVLGYTLDTPSKFIICWTKDGKDIGGTAQALRLAREHKIPIHNLGNTDTVRLWMKKVNGQTSGKY